MAICSNMFHIEFKLPKAKFSALLFYIKYTKDVYDLFSHIQGVPKKMRLMFCFISRKPCIGFSNNFLPPEN